MNLRFFLSLFWTNFLLLPQFSSAQDLGVSKYPQGYFRNPLDLPMSLSGNFGELRPNHFHMGLDLKTMAKVNYYVYAAADGYVARVKIEPFGFGRAIYISHPNGYTTLYAHLNNFFPALEAYVKKQQYLQQSWSVFLDLPPGMFMVKKGDFIAFSGTTGGSQAPHLHFEVRRTFDDVNLNPLLFGFPLLDNVKPAILRLALYDRNNSTYEQTPKLIPVKNTASGYLTTPTLIKTTAAKISFAISAYDTHSGSTNQNGIYEASLYDNGALINRFRIENISYNETRYINAHIDYKSKASRGIYLQHLSLLPGYLNPIYNKIKGDGVIDLGDEAVHAIRIVVKDAYGNASELNTSVQYAPGPALNPPLSGKMFYPNASAPAVKPPLSGKMFYPLMIGVNESEDCEFFIGENCLYDSVHIGYARSLPSGPGAVSATHAIGSTFIPLQDALVIRIKPVQNIPAQKMGQVVMQWFSGTSKDVSKVVWQQGWCTAMFRDFGNFRLLVDDEPPQIIPVGFVNGANLARAAGMAFTVRDNLEAFKNFRAELDGRWICFSNDKGRTFIYRFDEMCLPGPHELKVSVEDEAGNVAVKTFQFTR